MANRCIDKVSIDVDAFRGLLKRNNMHITGKNGLDLVLDRDAKTIRRWLAAGEIPESMIDDICNALKCKKEEFVAESEKRPVSEWVYDTTIGGMRYYRCSNCTKGVETLADEDEAKWWRFCPRCGSKMFTKENKK